MLTEKIKQKLEQAFPDSQVEVVNTSSQHIGHDAGGAHLKVIIAYQGFKGKTMVQQHQMVYDALKQEMEQEIHALRIETKIN